MRILILLGVNGIALGSFCQSPNTPTFEVASVKLNQLDTRGFIGAVPGGKGFRGFKATSARLKILVMLAYNIPDSQIT